MKPEQSEQFLIEELISQSKKREKIDNEDIVYVDKLTGDASTRRYYRANTKNRSYVVCLDNPLKEGDRNKFIDVQEFLSSKNVRVPKVYDCLLNRGYILEEDLGDETLLKKLAEINTIDEEYEVYKKVIDILISIHSIDSQEVQNSGLFYESFDFEKLNSEMDFSTKFFIKKFLGIEDNYLISDLNKLFEPICKNLSSKKMLLTHRDFHSRNIMILGEEKVVIDFQDSRMGIPQYDLVSMLEDCYYSIHKTNKDKLIEYYLSKISLSSIDQTQDEFVKLYNDMSIQRVFKAIGSFAYIYEGRKDLRYVKYIGYAMERLKEFLFKSPEYKDLRKQLFTVYYAN